ncbi:hypothetical protein GXW74_27450 [Roseomonas eburnea]|uniref:Uncharacterized protein n=1 Tax=Neoroseomonas eburnea TaxID=1346889 RepID=A0A9X9XKJ5_9PROT|nr:hypothetical protein [Neoroseomonas eburnea]MBR0684231.1 hypothetical protein [Neoroseomonas eburnea]
MTASRERFTSEDDLRHEVVECPACGEPTMPNLLADGSCVCSCPAERALPLPEGAAPALPPPVDDTSFVAAVHDASAGLPEFKGQFGRDIQTDDFKLLNDPPGEGQQAGDGEASPPRAPPPRT